VDFFDWPVDGKPVVNRVEPAVTEPQGTGIVFRRGQVSFGTGIGNLVKQSVTVFSPTSPTSPQTRLTII